MKVVLGAIIFFGLYLGIDLIAGVVSPWFGPLAIWSLLVALIVALVKIGRA